MQEFHVSRFQESFSLATLSDFPGDTRKDVLNSAGFLKKHAFFSSLETFPVFFFPSYAIVQAEEITLTIGQAFDLAYKRFLSGKAAESESEKIARLER